MISRAFWIFMNNSEFFNSLNNGKAFSSMALLKGSQNAITGILLDKAILKVVFGPSTINILHFIDSVCKSPLMIFKLG